MDWRPLVISPALFSVRRLLIAVWMCLAALPAALAQSGAQADDPSASLRFEGVVETARRALVSNQMDGLIEKLHFSGGEEVVAGQLLVELDAAAFRIAIDAAAARVAQARAELNLAETAAKRQARLVARGVAPEAREEDASTALAVARAGLSEAEASLGRAKLALERTQIAAPIAGRISRPKVAEGAFVEAESRAPIGEIIQIDPILVAYKVPYATRLATLRRTGSTRLDDLLKRVELHLELPTGERYPHEGRVAFASTDIDPNTGLLTVWARFENPDGLLVPGLKVSVRSQIEGLDAAAPDGTSQ